MAVRYEYKALSQDGHHRIGVFTAENVDQVTDFLEGQHLVPISVKPKKENISLSSLRLFQKVNYEDLIMFTANLSTMYRAGIPLLRALSIIKIGAPNGPINIAIPKLRAAVHSGKSLSQAMGEHKHIFSDVYVSSIAAGEESGKLDEILDELSEMLEKDLEISRLIKSGLRYPAIVLFVITIAFTIIMTFVIPKFVNFYASFDAALPLPTQIIIGISNFITGYWWILLSLIVTIVYGFKLALNNPGSKLFIDKTCLKIPLFGMLAIKGNIARFSLMFRILFKSGLPIIKSLDILINSVKNSMIQLEIKKINDLFSRGSENELLSTEFLFFPDLAKQMIAIGLESGSLERMLEEIGTHYSKEVQYTSRHLTAILEPVLTLIISAFVLLMALAIFLPMWNLIKVFGGG